MFTLKSLLLPFVLGLAASPSVLTFPEPSGPYAIGTLTYHWVDRERPEIFSSDPNAPRELMVQLWYPATRRRGAQHAPYIQDAQQVLTALARLQNLEQLTSLAPAIEAATSNAVEAAPVARHEQRYPVLIFLEGLTGFRQMNTYQVEALVSRGFVVAALDQPYAAAAVVFPDGREVGLSRDELLSQFNPALDQSLSPVEPAPTLHGRSFADGIVPFLAQDVSFALERLAELDHGDPQGILTGRLNLKRAGVLGISLGGIVASEACLRESALSACLVMDAPMPADVVASGLKKPSMWITRDSATMRQEGWTEADIEQHQSTMRSVYESVSSAGYFVQAPGTFHADFTDIPAWSPVFTQLGFSGPIGVERAHAIIEAYSVAFFARHLKDCETPLLAGPSDAFPEVLFEGKDLREGHQYRSDAL
jgi:pimeloyl-ACP methyl ester carboxylesterase